LRDSFVADAGLGRLLPLPSGVRILLNPSPQPAGPALQALPAGFPAGATRWTPETSLAFSVHHHPGALLDCLKRFADHQINLTRLESRPIPANPFEYVFFIDFLGGLDDGAVRSALEELRAAARHVKVIGSYPLAERPRAGTT